MKLGTRLVVQLLVTVFVCTVISGQQFQGLKQETVVDKIFGVIMGTRDVLQGYTDDFRIPQETKEYLPKLHVYKDSPVEISLGVAPWVPVQISVLMKQFEHSSTRGPVCVAQEEGLEYEVKSKLELSGSDSIYDYEILENHIYLLTSKYELEVVRLEEHEGITSLMPAWIISDLDKKSTSLLGSVFQGVGLAIHKQTQTIYMPTNLGLLKADSKTKAVTITGKNVYVPATNIIFTDIVNDYLFVGFMEQGVYVYDVRNPESIKKVGLFDKYFFGGKLEEKFLINHFFVNFHLVQSYQTDTKSTPKQEPVDDVFFVPKSSEIPNHDIDKLRFPVLLIASNLGVHLIDISTIIENGVMPTSEYSILIPVPDASRVIRYHNTIYILKNDYSNLEDATSVKSTISEIILIENDETRYRKSTKAEDLYKFNRIAHLPMQISNIFADADFFYMIGVNTHYVYPRGIPMDSQSMLHSLGKSIQEPNIHGLLTVHIGSETSLLAFGTQNIVDSRLRITDPYIRCQHNGKELEGKYVLEVNATTLNCPHKQTSPKIGFKMRATNTCRWTRLLTVNFHDTGKYGYGFFGKTLRMVEYLIIIVFIVLLGILCVFFRRNRVIQAEYERLKREIGVRGDGSSTAGQEAAYYNKDPNKSGLQQLEFGQVEGSPTEGQEV